VGSVAGEAGTKSGSLLTLAMMGPLVAAAYTGLVMIIPSMYAPLYLSSLGVADPFMLSIPGTLASTVAVFAAMAYAPLNRRLGVAGVSAVALVGMGCSLMLAGVTHMTAIFTAAIAVQGGLMSITVANCNAGAAGAAPPAMTGAAIGLVNS